MLNLSRALSLLVVSVLVVPIRVGAANRWDVVESGEMAQAQKWFDGRVDALDGKAEPEAAHWRGVSQGWGTFQVGWSVNHLPLKLNGKVHETGIASHADAVVELTVPPGSKRLTGVGG